MKKTFYFLTCGLLAVLCIALGFFGFSKQADAVKAESLLENSYSSSLSSCASAMRTIECDLSKLMITTDAEKQNLLLATIAQTAYGCAESISGLPVIATGMQDVLKFANQISAYCALMLKREKDENFDNQIIEFFQTSAKANALISEAENSISAGKLSLADLSNNGNLGIFSTEEQPIEYPSVIFDGPFSDGQSYTTPLSDRPYVDKQTALGCAKKFIVDEFSVTDSAGDVEAYLLTGTKSSVLVSKKGGILLSLVVNNRQGDTVLSDDELQQIATEYARMICEDAVVVWQEQYGNSIVFNFAPKVGECTYYPDVFKVKISFDGQLCGIEARNFYMENHVRKPQSPTISQNEAQAMLKSGFEVETSRLCIISIDRQEHLAWEFFGNYNDNAYSIYISAIDGKQLTEFRIISTDTGKMVV